MAKLHLNFKNMPKDAEIEVPPYGVFRNRHIYEVSALDDELILGEELDHKTVLKWPLEKETTQEEIPAGGADLKAPPEDMGQPAGDTKKEEGE